MSLDFTHYALDAAIARAAKDAWAAANAEHPEHEFFAFALTTLSNAQYIECSLNSERNLRVLLSRAGLASVFGRLGFKWGPPEWGEFEYFGQGKQDFFSSVQILLACIEADADAAALADLGLTEPPFEPTDLHYGAFWQRNTERRRYVFEMMIAALRLMDDEGVFGVGEARRNRIIFADIYDDEHSRELRALSAKINADRASTALINEFLRAG